MSTNDHTTESQLARSQQKAAQLKQELVEAREKITQLREELRTCVDLSESRWHDREELRTDLANSRDAIVVLGEEIARLLTERDKAQSMLSHGDELLVTMTADRNFSDKLLQCAKVERVRLEAERDALKTEVDKARQSLDAMGWTCSNCHHCPCECAPAAPVDRDYARLHDEDVWSIDLGTGLKAAPVATVEPATTVLPTASEARSTVSSIPPPPQPTLSVRPIGQMGRSELIAEIEWRRKQDEAYQGLITICEQSPARFLTFADRRRLALLSKRLPVRR